MDKWRFLEIDWLTYAETAIYRPVLMRAVSEETVPDTVSFCRFPKPSLVLNYFNDPDKDINLDLCGQMDIPVYRVIASGGPIFGDRSYIFTFLHINIKSPRIPPDVPGMFEKTLSGVAQGISQYFDIECRFRPLNDIEVRCDDGMWRKIGPSSCFYEEKAVQMGSGIQIKEPNADLIAEVINAPPEKFMDKEAKSIQERITYLEKVVGRDIDFEEIRNIYWGSLEKVFEVQFSEGELTNTEKTYLNEMEKEYTSQEFFMDRSEEKFNNLSSDCVRNTVRFKVPGGPFVRIITFTKGGRMIHLLISGHIHASPLRPTSPVHEIEKALEDSPVNQDLFKSRIQEILARPGFSFAGISSGLLAEKIHQCATGRESATTG